MKEAWVLERHQDGGWYIYWRREFKDSGYVERGPILGAGAHKGRFDIGAHEPSHHRAWKQAHNEAVDVLHDMNIGDRWRTGFVFSKVADGRQALRVIRSAMKQVKDNKLGDRWILQAQAAGWKSQRGPGPGRSSQMRGRTAGDRTQNLLLPDVSALASDVETDG